MSAYTGNAEFGNWRSWTRKVKEMATPKRSTTVPGVSVGAGGASAVIGAGQRALAMATEKEDRPQVFAAFSVQVLVPGTPLAFGGYRVPNRASIEIKPDPANAGAIFVGPIPRPRSAVGVASGNAVKLNPGDNPIYIAADVLSHYFVDADTANDRAQLIARW